MNDSEPRAIKFVQAQVGVEGEFCQAVVELESRESGRFVGKAQGGLSETDRLRAVARAASDALSDAFEAKNARVRVVNVQLVEGIMQKVVVVFLSATREAQTQSLVGVCDGTGDLTTATALAVLNATNRFLDRA